MVDADRTLSVALIAHCSEHGLHGQRDRCFECGKPVEQIEMVEAETVRPILEAAYLLRDQWRRMQEGPLPEIGQGGLEQAGLMAEFTGEMASINLEDLFIQLDKLEAT